MRKTRDAVRDFNLAFGRPVNESLANLTVTERELLGKLLIEEAIETVTLGLGLKLVVKPRWVAESNMQVELLHDDNSPTEGELTLVLNEGQKYDPVEFADGLGDVNIVIHFSAHWAGFNLDRVTDHINDSNMSKLDPSGKPIINGETPGYQNGLRALDNSEYDEPGFDPTKPIGKILKSPQFWDAKPGIEGIIQEGNH